MSPPFQIKDSLSENGDSDYHPGQESSPLSTLVEGLGLPLVAVRTPS